MINFASQRNVFFDKNNDIMALFDQISEDLTSSLVRYFYLPHDGTYGFKGVSEDLTGDAG